MLNQEKLPESKRWHISSILIFANSGRKLYSQDFDSDEQNISKSLILSFLDTVKNFSSDTLDETVYEIGFSDRRLLFHNSDQLVLLAVIKHGDDVKTGKNSAMTKITLKTLENIANKIEAMENIEPVTIKTTLGNNIDRMVSTINKSSTNPNSAFHNISDYKMMENWNVLAVIITNNSGIPLATRMYSDTIKNDPILISSFLTAVKAFSQDVFSNSLDDIIMQDYRTYFQTHNKKIYTIIIKTQGEEFSLSYNSPVNQFIRDLLDNLSTTVEMMFGEELNPGSSGSDAVLDKAIDQFVREKLNEDIDNKYKS